MMQNVSESGDYHEVDAWLIAYVLFFSTKAPFRRLPHVAGNLAEGPSIRLFFFS